MDHVRTYIGVDVSGDAVQKARGLGLDARVIDDAAALPFRDGSFDAVVCLEVLEHLFAPQLVAAEIFRVLRPGGVLLATVPNVAYWRGRVELALLGRFDPYGDDLSVVQPWGDPHIRFFTVGSLRRILRMTGYRPIIIGGHGGMLLSDIPLVGRTLYRLRLIRGRASRLYPYLARAWPQLLALRLHVAATKPDLTG